MSSPHAAKASNNQENLPALSSGLRLLISDKVKLLLSSKPSLTDISHMAHFVDKNDLNPRLTKMIATAIIAVWWDLFGIPHSYESGNNMKDLAVKSARYIPLNTVLSSVARAVPNCGDYNHHQAVSSSLAEAIINNIRSIGLHGASLVQFVDAVSFGVNSVHLQSCKITEIENTDSWYFMVLAL